MTEGMKKNLFLVFCLKPILQSCYKGIDHHVGLPSKSKLEIVYKTNGIF